MQIIKLSHVGDAEPVKSTCSLQFINPNKPNFKEILENIDIPIILTYHEIAQTDASEIGGNYQLKLTNCKCDKDVQLVPFPSTFNYASKNIVADTVMITDFTFHFLPRKSSNYLEMIVHSNGSTLAYTNAVTFSYYTTIIFALMVIVLAQLLFRMIGYTHIALFDMQRIGCSEENLERIPSSALVSCITDAPQWIHTDTDINTELHVIEDHIEGLHSSAENQPSMYDFKSLTDDAINIDDDNSDEMLLVNVTSTNIMLKATIASITSFPDENQEDAWNKIFTKIYNEDVSDIPELVTPEPEPLSSSEPHPPMRAEPVSEFSSCCDSWEKVKKRDKHIDEDNNHDA